MDFFNSRIHNWYSLHKRDLPWRNTRNPYFIWLSEIILQQTRIEQGLTYYMEFTREFPTITKLANASEDQVLKLWQGLGYYSRARNLHHTAKLIQQQHNGTFPSDYQSIRSLKGIGDYTAAAIASISFDLEYPAVDGNVYRLLSRFFGINSPIDTNSGKKIFSNLAMELIKGTTPGIHNQALMEFGALQCTPKAPDCDKCPLQERCFALSAKKINELPVKQNKTKQRDRFFNYWVVNTQNHLFLHKRVENDIWKNLFEFPLMESSDQISSEQLIAWIETTSSINMTEAVIENISSWKIHKLSHQRIHYRFIRIRLLNEITLPDGVFRVNKKDIFNFAVPKLLETYIDEWVKNGLLS